KIESLDLWPVHGTSGFLDEVTLSRKGEKSRTRITGLRLKRTKARTHVDRAREPQAELEKKLEARTRALDEALDQQNRDLRDIERHLELAYRRPSSARRGRRECCSSLRGVRRGDRASRRRRRSEPCALRATRCC